MRLFLFSLLFCALLPCVGFAADDAAQEALVRKLTTQVLAATANSEDIKIEALARKITTALLSTPEVSAMQAPEVLPEPVAAPQVPTPPVIVPESPSPQLATPKVVEAEPEIDLDDPQTQALARKITMAILSSQAVPSVVPAAPKTPTRMTAQSRDENLSRKITAAILPPQIEGALALPQAITRKPTAMTDGMLCEALKNAIMNDDPTSLMQLTKQPRALELLATEATMNGQKKKLINTLLLDAINTHKSAGLISVLVKVGMTATRDLSEVENMLHLVQATAENSSSVLSTIARDESLVGAIIAAGNDGDAKTGKSCLELLKSSLQYAPSYVQIGYQGLSFAVKGSAAIVKGTSNWIMRIKDGRGVTSHNKHNIVHIAVLRNWPGVLSWSIMNCRPEVLDQRNAQNLTPRELAAMKLLTLTQKQKMLKMRTKTGVHPFLKMQLRSVQKKIGRIRTMLEMLTDAIRFRAKIDEVRLENGIPLMDGGIDILRTTVTELQEEDSWASDMSFSGVSSDEDEDSQI